MMFIFLALIINSHALLCQNSKNIAKSPQKFGLQTMTFARPQLNHQMDIFNKYLNHYANLDCECFLNIYIIWNNQETPQQRGIIINQKWIKKVIITKTPYNSLGWKYVIPETAQQQLFFAVDDDLLLTCDQLQSGFNKWKQNSIGDLGPLVSYLKRSMSYDNLQQKFQYDVNNKKIFTIGLMGCAFFPRQFADLYYSQFQQIKNIRRVVQQLHNCQDIAMNFIVSYFYPELIPLIQQNSFDTNFHFNGLSDKPKHYQNRNRCIDQFSFILSYNPLRFVSVKDQSKIIRLNQTCLALKKQQVYNTFIKRKTPKQIFEADGNFRLDQVFYTPNHFQTEAHPAFVNKDTFLVIFTLILLIIVAAQCWKIQQLKAKVNNKLYIEWQHQQTNSAIKENRQFL